MSNAEYWKKRFEVLEDEQYKKSQKYIDDVEKQFREAQNDITLDIWHWYQRLADNNDISLASAKKLLKKNELEEFHWSVEQYIKAGEENAVDKRWMKQLENASAKVHIQMLEAMKLQMQQHAELLYTKYHNGVTDYLNKSYAERFYHTAYEIQKGTSIGSNVAVLDKRKIDKVLATPWAVDGKNFSDRIWTNKGKLVNELHRELTQSLIRGDDPQKAINNIAKNLNTSKVNAGRLVMTETAAISSAAQNDCFAELGVEQYEIVATLDSHTSDICRDMDGKHFPMSQWEVGVTAPPFHVWCRSTTVPFFDDEFDCVGERAARGEDGKTYYVPADMTYKQWEKSFVGGDDKTGLQKATPDIKFSTKQGTNITNKQKFNDTKTALSAFDDLPVKVQQNFSDVIFELGYNGSACDIWNRTIRVGIGVTKEEVYHEFGHLIENYMMNQTDVKKYKEHLVDGLKYSDIMIQTYYDNVGNAVDIFVLKGSEFESEYQSRLYVSDITEALNEDGTINVDVLGEAISEPFRKYMNGEDISDVSRKMIEGVVL